MMRGNILHTKHLKGCLALLPLSGRLMVCTAEEETSAPHHCAHSLTSLSHCDMF